MSRRKKQFRLLHNLFKQIGRLSGAISKAIVNWLLRSLMILGRRRSPLAQAGFVLPTVVMVTLVVVLLTTAIMFRSFDRSKNASNVRVNEVVLRAAEPAIDRARAKMDAVFSDPTLPRSTPSDRALYTAFQNNKYTFGDETRLKLAYDFGDGAGGTTPNNTIENSPFLERNETLNTAWRFPVDTDNNGQYDSFTLYSINFRSPTRTGANFNRDRSPLDARTPPMSEGAVGGQCAAANQTSAGLVGDSDWYKTGSELKKSFFVYVANVPITDTTGLPAADKPYETYKGNQGFSALELQQDKSAIPLSNNAVWFDDDIDISGATNFRLNGRVFTNSNLMVVGGGPIRGTANNVYFYQVSSPKSCYYLEENGKIVVGGNVENAGIEPTEQDNKGLVEVHRFLEDDEPNGQNLGAGINAARNTADAVGAPSPGYVGYNTLAYAERVGGMVEAAFAFAPALTTQNAIDGVAQYPEEVKDNFKARFGEKDAAELLREELENYFRERTRRVPYAEVAFGGDAFVGVAPANPFGATNPVRPPDAWMSIAPADTNVAIEYLDATVPKLQELAGQEYHLGDRINVGNSLPQIWYDFDEGNFADEGDTQDIAGVNWNKPGGGDSGEQRTRKSQIETQPDLGNIGRNGFWEIQAATLPGQNENTGGLRVVTGAGIYRNPASTFTALSDPSFLTAPTALDSGATIPNSDVLSTPGPYTLVWPDTMPMSRPDDPTTPNPPDDESTKPSDLRMRATAVYHYADGANSVGTDQLPIACISSYYDPTNLTTARNPSTDSLGRALPDVSGVIDTDGDGAIDASADGSALVLPQPDVAAGARSNNGVSYPDPYGGVTVDRESNPYIDELRAQASMMFPNGRLANKPLYDAFKKIDGSQTLTLADNSAIDSAVCAIRILTEPGFAPLATKVPHGAIKEATLLDGRQIKSITAVPDENLTQIAELQSQVTSTEYDLYLEQRQPLEVRVTEIDLNLLRGTPIGSPTNTAANDPNNDEEFLLPNSGIIFATRDDALPDLSAAEDAPATPIDESLFPDFDQSADTRLVSPNDFQLDPTRRPNGIRLINGQNLARETFDRIAEKGLILATNLPVYVRGDFNLHDFEEFQTPLTAGTWGNFYDRNVLEDDFACRPGKPGCGPTGDNWRPATIISDSVTLLSDDFLDGFRADGDYDLNNNAGNSVAQSRFNQGFWFNDFATSANWDGADDANVFPDQLTSYLANGATPVQRRENFQEYLMEVCPKIPVSACTPNDWYLDPTTGLKASNAIGQPFDIAIHKAGTTAVEADATLAGFPRRVAFQRDGSGNLLTAGGSPVATITDSPVPLGIENAGGPNGRINRFPYTNTARPRLRDNALWFATSTNTTDPQAGSETDNDRYSDDNSLYIYQMPTDPAGTIDRTGQPILMPMLQIHSPTGRPGSVANAFGGFIEDRWLPVAEPTTFNAVFVSGDSPSRPLAPSGVGESGGGLPNFVRFLEGWDNQTATIRGSFIQTRKSAYATAPIKAADPAIDTSLFYDQPNTTYMRQSNPGFRYRGGAFAKRSPFYKAPDREWGFDVGLLTQLPDLFAQRFTTKDPSPPQEFFREVGRDDPWVNTLLCAGAASDRLGTASGVTFTDAVPNPPAGCPAIPANP